MAGGQRKLASGTGTARQGDTVRGAYPGHVRRELPVGELDGLEREGRPVFGEDLRARVLPDVEAEEVRVSARVHGSRWRGDS